MNNLIFYLLQSGISISLLYGVYWLFLRKDTFFVINRLFLVTAVVFSLVFPLLNIRIPVNATDNNYLVMLDAITITADGLGNTVQQNFDTFQVLGIIYLTGVSIFFIKFLIQVGQLLLLVRKYGVSKEQGLNIVFVDRNYAPFSFFNLIFINRRDLSETNIREIITHEQVHIRQRHSIDLMILEIMTIVQWFNPVIWFYRHSLKTIHEYLADEGVLLKGFDAINYQKLLLAQSTGIQVNDLTNNFNHSLIKKRILMMTKLKSGSWARLKVLLVTPVAFVMALAFIGVACENQHVQVEKPVPNVEKQSNQHDHQSDTPIFTVVEEMPTFPGGTKALIEYIRQNVKYSEEARKTGKQGTVFVTFVIEKNGNVTNVKVLRGVDKSLDEVAVKAIENMPAWKPGMQQGEPVRVQFNVPVRFTLGQDHEKTPPPPPPAPDKDRK